MHLEISLAAVFTSVTCASDTRFRFLNNFKKWVKETTFYPVTSCSVTVEVVEHESEVEGVEHESETFLFDVLKGKGECSTCRRIFEDNHLIDCIDAVNWRRVDSFNIKQTVVCIMGV